MDPQAAEPEAASPAFWMTAEYAPLGHRAAARLVDVVLHYAVAMYTALWMAFATAFVGPGLLQKFAESKLFAIGFGILGSILYQTCMEGVHGSSLGKRIFGITVLDAEGGPCTLRQAWKRSLAFLVDGLFVGLIGYLNAKGCPRRQRVGDDWADTVVVRTRSVPAPLRRSGRELFAAAVGGFACDSIVLTLGYVLAFWIG